MSVPSMIPRQADIREGAASDSGRRNGPTKRYTRIKPSIPSNESDSSISSNDSSASSSSSSVFTGTALSGAYEFALMQLIALVPRIEKWRDSIKSAISVYILPLITSILSLKTKLIEFVSALISLAFEYLAAFKRFMIRDSVKKCVDIAFDIAQIPIALFFRIVSGIYATILAKIEDLAVPFMGYVMGLFDAFKDQAKKIVGKDRFNQFQTDYLEPFILIASTLIGFVLGSIKWATQVFKGLLWERDLSLNDAFYLFVDALDKTIDHGFEIFDPQGQGKESLYGWMVHMSHVKPFLVKLQKKQF